jgi:Family of unknown function (DUF5719)
MSALHPALRAVVFAAVAAALVGLGWVVKAPSSSGADAASVTVPVDSTSLVCPSATYAAGATSTNIAAIAVPAEPPAAPSGVPALNANGTLTVGPLAGGGSPVSVDGRQQVARYNPAAKTPAAVTVRGSGVLAPGVAASQLTTSTEGNEHGLSEAACTPPGSAFWFVGAGSAVGRHGRIYLTNVDSAKASARLLLFDEKGPISPDRTRSIEVQPGKQVTIELDELAPTSERIAVHVEVTQGRVAAAMRDQVMSGGTAAGIDWIPASLPPARGFIVPGLASGAGQRTLTLVAPGDSTAVVDVAILGREGAFEPAELGNLEVEPGTVLQVDLAKVSIKQGSAIRIRSDVPVAASVRSDTAAAEGVRDFAFSVPSVPMTTPGVVPLTTTEAASLLVTNPGTAQTAVAVAVLDETGKELSKTSVAVGPGATATKAVEAPAGVARYVLVVTPEKGRPIYAVRQLNGTAGGPMLSLYPISSAPLTVQRPVARPQLGSSS